MTTADAWTRLAQCRSNQPGHVGVIVAAEIIDTLLDSNARLFEFGEEMARIQGYDDKEAA
jgi:hypothetical protein